MKPPIQSKKHIVQFTLANAVGGAVSNLLIAEGVESGSALPTDVEYGSQIKAVYCELWVQSSASTITTFVAGFYKQPGTGAAITAAQAAALHDWNNKNNLFYTTQGLVPGTTTNIIPAMKFWIKIPKGKQRLALGDKYRVFVRALGVDDVNFCGQFTFKEYS